MIYLRLYFLRIPLLLVLLLPSSIIHISAQGKQLITDTIKSGRCGDMFFVEDNHTRFYLDSISYLELREVIEQNFFSLNRIVTLKPFDCSQSNSRSREKGIRLNNYIDPNCFSDKLAARISVRDSRKGKENHSIKMTVRYCDLEPWHATYLMVYKIIDRNGERLFEVNKFSLIKHHRELLFDSIAQGECGDCLFVENSRRRFCIDKMDNSELGEIVKQNFAVFDKTLSSEEIRCRKLPVDVDGQVIVNSISDCTYGKIIAGISFLEENRENGNHNVKLRITYCNTISRIVLYNLTYRIIKKRKGIYFKVIKLKYWADEI
jgi:hypothetical protein